MRCCSLCYELWQSPSIHTCSEVTTQTCLVRKGQVAVQCIQVLYELIEISPQCPQHVVVAWALAEFKEILSKLPQNNVSGDTWQNKDTLRNKKGLEVLAMLSGRLRLKAENLQQREGIPKGTVWAADSGLTQADPSLRHANTYLILCRPCRQAALWSHLCKPQKSRKNPGLQPSAYNREDNILVSAGLQIQRAWVTQLAFVKYCLLWTYSSTPSSVLLEHTASPNDGRLISKCFKLIQLL